MTRGGRDGRGRGEAVALKEEEMDEGAGRRKKGSRGGGNTGRRMRVDE